MLWKLTEKQWWVTGFNPSYFGNVEVSKQVMVCSIDFSGNQEMYNALKDTANIENARYNEEIVKYGVFDENNTILWLAWYREELKK